MDPVGFGFVQGWPAMSMQLYIMNLITRWLKNKNETGKFPCRSDPENEVMKRLRICVQTAILFELHHDY